MPNSSCETTVGHRQKILFVTISLSLIILIIYSNSFHCSWHLDDFTNIVKNPGLHLESLTFHGLKGSLFSDPGASGRLYRPVACLSFALNYYFSGLDVFAYHLTNICIHFLSSLFLFLFLFDTLNLPSLRKKYARSSYFVALLATFFWALNPVQTGGVTYIVQRMSSLAAMFYILSMYAYLESRMAVNMRKRVLFSILCFLFFLLAFWSKENAVMLPLSLVLYEVLLVQQKPSLFSRKNALCFVVVLGATILIAIIYFHYKGERAFSFLEGYKQRPFTLAQRLLTESRVIVFYISLLLYPSPHRLSIAHSVPLSNGIFHPVSTFFCIFFILAAIIYLVAISRKYPFISFCYLFFFLNHVVESSFLPLELVFEHRNYLPSMMFFAPVALGLWKLLERNSEKKVVKTLVSGFIVFVLVCFAGFTYIRNFSWKNEKTLWMDAARKAPDQLRVHHNLGLYYQTHGHAKQAMGEYLRALNSPVINRKDEPVMTYYQLGKLYGQIGSYEIARAYYEKALSLKPDLSLALVNLASIYDRKGERQKADQYLLRAYKNNPGDPYINFNMGIRALSKGNADKAIEHLEIAKRQKSLKSRALMYEGVSYREKNMLEKAAKTLKQSVMEDRGNVSARLYLIGVLSRAGQEGVAEKEAAKVAKIIASDDSLFQEVTKVFSSPKGRSSHLRFSENTFSLILKQLRGSREKFDKRTESVKKTLKKDKEIR